MSTEVFSLASYRDKPWKAGVDTGALCNVELEAMVLGGLMADNSQIDSVADVLVATDFYEPIHSRIFDVIVHQCSLGKTVSPVTVKPFFEGADDPIQELGGPVYLASLFRDANVLHANLRICARDLRELSERRRMFDGLARSMDLCANPEVAIADVIAEADASVTLRAEDSVVQLTGGEAIADMIRGFDEPTHGVTCGCIPELDKLLGPIRPKQLIIGAGRPGMGKTALALSYALGAAKQGHGVLFVSLEMSARELAARMTADLCFNGRDGVPFHAIRDGRLNSEDMAQVVKAESRMHGLPFRMVDTGSLTVGRLNMIVRRNARRFAAAGKKLELVVVDYLQLLSPDTKGRSNYEAISEVSKALKSIAKDRGIAMLALAQLSREVEKRPDKRPQLADLRDSGQIEQDADAVLFLLRDEYYLNQAKPEPFSPRFADWESNMEQARGRIEFILAKRRNGTTGSAFGTFHGQYQAVRGSE